MITVLVHAKEVIAEGICLFELVSANDETLPPFSAGAHVDVILPNGITRQYSLCNYPHDTHRYQIAVLKDPASRGGSVAMHEQISIGDQIQISEPKNLFPLAHDAKKSLLFAGGIGITPILCMAERLAHTGADFELHYCTRSPAKTAFIERIQASNFADCVHFHFDDNDAAQKLDAADILSTPQADTHIYVCGPTGFMEHVLETATAQHWQPEQLHREYFSAKPISHENDGSFDVQISSTGQIINVPADKTVIEALEACGIEIPFSCESGICGTCLTGVLAGIPEHKDSFLTEEEQAENDQFTPCCSRAKSAQLVLDI